MNHLAKKHVFKEICKVFAKKQVLKDRERERESIVPPCIIALINVKVNVW